MLGIELKEYGKVFEDENLMLVHKKLAAGETINPHNHPGQDIFFTVVSGKLEVYLDEEEMHTMEPKKVLNFKGERRISAKAIEDSDVFVYLINRKY